MCHPIFVRTASSCCNEPRLNCTCLWQSQFLCQLLATEKMSLWQMVDHNKHLLACRKSSQRHYTQWPIDDHHLLFLSILSQLVIDEPWLFWRDMMRTPWVCNPVAIWITRHQIYRDEINIYCHEVDDTRFLWLMAIISYRSSIVNTWSLGNWVSSSEFEALNIPVANLFAVVASHLMLIQCCRHWLQMLMRIPWALVVLRMFRYIILILVMLRISHSWVFAWIATLAVLCH